MIYISILIAHRTAESNEICQTSVYPLNKYDLYTHELTSASIENTGLVKNHYVFKRTDLGTGAAILNQSYGPRCSTERNHYT